MARRRRGRPIDGVLILDKPVGRSSNGALQAARAIFNAQKAGHTGSLDPLASGVLPVCFGEATKFSQYLLDADKAYESTFVLGQRTDTCDAEGEVLEQRSAAAITEQQVLNAIQDFIGEIEQVPPMYSAIKKDGRKLYELAREGKEVERKARKITIHSYELLDFQPGELCKVKVAVSCTKGTYIRTLADDLGDKLGVGGHVCELRRTKAGKFSLDGAVTIPAIEALRGEEAFADLDALLLPADAAVEDLPKLQLNEDASRYMLQGNPVMVSKAPLNTDFRLYTHDDRFLGLGFVRDDGMVGARRLISTAET